MIVNKLTMCAFEPFVDEVTVDFTVYHGQEFLIDGKTGAGKTSIFDGITYALFGRASGSIRSASTLRNQQANAKTKSYVQLEFSANGSTYTIYRETPAVNADGTKKAGTIKCRLDMPDGSTVVQTRLIEEQIKRITGFEFDSFCRVSMLAQGEFDSFLRLDSGEKEKVLRKIFRTYRYEDFQKKIIERRKALSDMAGSAQREYELAMSDYFGDASEPEKKLSNAPFFIEQCGEKLSQTAEEIAAVTAEYTDITKQIKQAAQALTQAINDNKAFDDRDKAAEHFALLEQRKAEFEEKSDLAAGRQRAAEAFSYSKNVVLANAALTERKSALAAAEVSLKAAQSARLSAGQAKQKADSDAEKISALSEKQHALNDLLKQFADAEEQETLAKSLEQETKAIGKKVEDSEKKICANEQSIEKNAADLAAARETAQRTAELSLLCDKAAKDCEDISALSAAIAESGERRKAADTAKVLSDKARKKYEEADINFTRTSYEYFADAAGRLAQKLNLGECCPVCGSTEHPHPALCKENAPTQDEVDAAKKRSDAARAVSEKKAAEYSAANAEYLAGLTALKADYLALIGEEMPESGAQQLVSERENALQAALSERQSELTGAVAAQKCEAALYANSEKLTTEREKLTAAHEQLLSSLKEQSAKSAAQRTLADDRWDSLGGKTRDEVQGELSQAISMTEQLQKAADSAAKALTRAEKALSAAEATLTETTAQAESAKTALAAAQRELSESLAANGFASEAEMKALYVPKPERDALEREIAEFQTNLASAKSALDTCTAKLPQNGGRRDLTALEQQESELSERQLKADERKQSLLIEQNALSVCISRSKEIYDKNSENARQLSIYARLEAAVNGTGETRISFERYIQRQIFDRVLYYANSRMDVLSDGQYQLDTRTRGATKRAATGLDIDIIDRSRSDKNYRRDASTLSGGERFLASFALAIGLSDFALEQNGSTHSDMLFIDEGFSNLDTTTFGYAEKVIDTISSQARMVGLVSHIEGIQEHFRDRRITVTKTQTGSKITQTLPLG